MGNEEILSKDEAERRQLELATRALRGNPAQRDWMCSLSRVDRELLFTELGSHHSLHLAEGNNAECVLVLDLMRSAATSSQKLAYKVQRLIISEDERLGLVSRALKGMGELYDQYKNSKKYRARSAEVLMEYGILQDRHGDKELALKLFKNSIGRYERAEQEYNLSAAWFNTASVLYDLGKTRASLNACEKGLKLGGRKHTDLRTHLLLQRANGRERTSELEKACRDYLDAASGYKSLGNRRQQINIFFRVGWLLGKRNQVADAKRLLTEALRLARELDYATGLAEFHLQRAHFFFESGLEKRSLKHLQSGLQSAELAGSEGLKKRCRGLLYRTTRGLKRPLTFYLNASAGELNSQTLTKSQRATYARRPTDGSAQRAWRHPSRKAGKDATFLARLLAELGRRENRADLMAQSSAVSQWQRAVRQGRRFL